MNSNTFHNTCRNTSKYNESKNNCIEFQKKKKKKHRLIESPINYFHSQQNRTNVKRTAPPPPFEKKRREERKRERERRTRSITRSLIRNHSRAENHRAVSRVSILLRTRWKAVKRVVRLTNRLSVAIKYRGLIGFGSDHCGHGIGAR